MNIKEARSALNLLLKTNVGSVPLAPDFGLDWDLIIDLPTESAKAVIAAEIVEKQKKFIPEIEITSIECFVTADGEIEPKILFELSDYSEEDEEEDVAIEETDEEMEEEYDE